MIKISGVDVPNNYEELNVRQFDALNTIEADTNLSSMEKWISKFIYLGVPEEAFDDMMIDELEDIVAEFNAGFNDLPEERTTVVEIDGYTYEAKDKIGAKDFSLIEKAWKNDTKNFSKRALAILFKRSDLTRNEHYTNAHIKLKESLFEKQPCKIAVHYLNDVIEQITRTTEKLNEQTAE
jgi:hypothetical protein